MTMVATSNPGFARRLRKSLPAYGFLSPWLIGIFLLTAGPTIGSLYLSFTNFDLIQTPRWVGADNYASSPTIRNSSPQCR